MSEESSTNPIKPESTALAEPVRYTFHHGGHRWTFACTADDIPVVVRRLTELVDDPYAPIDRACANAVRNFFLHLSTNANSPQPRPKSVDLKP